MSRYEMIDYHDIEFSEEVLTSFAMAMVSEIRAFYESEEGRAYFEKWLEQHPEYRQAA